MTLIKLEDAVKAVLSVPAGTTCRGDAIVQALRSLPTDDGVTDMMAHIRKQAQRQDVRLAALDAVPMSEPKQLNASHWGRESVINDEQCLQIFEAMLDAIAALGPLPAPPAC